MSNPKHRIAVAMSGGVDSSVAAARLAHQGEDVFGLMMRLWSGDDSGYNRCCSPEDMAAARSVAAQLDIPFHVLDVRDVFKENVVDFFFDGYAQGVTPNPCLECNRHIRWGHLLQSALSLGASHLATGHYARVEASPDGYKLLRARDRRKDQSYVLSVMNQEQLSRAVFPLGEMTKEDARDYARKHKLHVAEKSESQDLCFIGHDDYRTLLREQNVQIPPPGEIVDQDGNLLGEHSGLADFTIGQRKGIGLSTEEPLYVLEKDLSRNALVVGRRDQLGRNEFPASRVHWVNGVAPDSTFQVSCKIRYKAKEVDAVIEPKDGDCAYVRLSKNVRDITPGQAAVFYDGEECLGGGIIDE